jgi:hypothetical protein
MHPSVYPAFHVISPKLEGHVDCLYADIKGLITCAVGCLVDPISLALDVPWTLEDGSVADQAQVRADWHLLKDNAGHYAKLHWKYARAATKVRLTEKAINDLVDKRLRANEAIIRKTFPEWESFPADAQLAMLSISWAVGAAFHIKFVNLANAIHAQKWAVAVGCAKIREDNNPGVRPRNAINYLCFANAQAVKDRGLDPAVLIWPETAKEAEPAATVPPTAAVRAVADRTSVEALDRLYASVQSDINRGAATHQSEYDAEPDDADPGPVA